jgi:hypothetical protein
MERNSLRAYRSWLKRRQDRLDEPDKLDWYLMQVAYETRLASYEDSAARKRLKIGEFRLKFESPVEQAKPLTEAAKQAAMNASKAIWYGIVNAYTKGRSKIVGPSEEAKPQAENPQVLPLRDKLNVRD